jgi:hypothetical protein
MEIVNRISECGQGVLNELAQADRINILRIAGRLGERSIIVYQAIGWLACERRIRYIQEGNQVYVALAEGRK